MQALNHDALEAIKAPDLAKQFAADGSDPAYSTSEEFRQVVNDTLNRAEVLIRETGLKLE